jgi:hypothetical protein
VHKDLLVACSPYFKAAFEGRFREADEKTIHIADIKVETFKDFLDWMYFRRLPEHRPDAEVVGSCDNCSVKTMILTEKKYRARGKAQTSESHEINDTTDQEEKVCDQEMKVSDQEVKVSDHELKVSDHEVKASDQEVKVAGQEGKASDQEIKSLEPNESSVEFDDTDLDDLVNRFRDDEVSLYIFADRCDVPQLRRDLTDQAFQEGLEPKISFPYYAAVLQTCQQLPFTSPLIRLYIDRYVARKWRPFHDRLCAKNCGIEARLRLKLPIEFVIAVTDGLLERADEEDDDYEDEDEEEKKEKEEKKNMIKRCSYHEHGQERATVEACINAFKKSRKRKWLDY